MSVAGALAQAESYTAADAETMELPNKEEGAAQAKEDPFARLEKGVEDKEARQRGRPQDSRAARGQRGQVQAMTTPSTKRSGASSGMPSQPQNPLRSSAVSAEGGHLRSSAGLQTGYSTSACT